MIHLLRRTFLCFVFVFILYSLWAQDGHYWTQQYGTRSMLLSGSVIGGVSDLGAVYYNPARLSQIENPAVLLSADVYEFNRFKIKDAFGKDKNTSRQDIKGIPSMAAGTFKIPFLKKHYFAWAILLRGNSDLSFSYKDEIYDDVINNFPGDEWFGTEMSVTQKTNDEWAGFNWSYPINEKLSIGASGFLSAYDQNKGLRLNIHAYSDSNQTAIYRYNRTVSFKQYSLMGKFGLACISNDFILGITVLSPRVRLHSNGSYNYEELYGGIDYSINKDKYTTSSQSELQTNYRSPWSIGLGITIPVKKNKIHLSSEWYSQLPYYTILEAEDHISQSDGDTISFKVADKFHSVINLGVGIEYYINEKISGYLSASTDFSAVTSDLSRFLENTYEVRNSVFEADYYHFGGGVVLNFQKANITLGVTYTGATQDFDRSLYFPEDIGDDIFGSIENPQLEWDRVCLVSQFLL